MKLKIVNARLSFPVLFEPEQFQGTGPACYACNLLVSSADAKAFVGDMDANNKTVYSKQIALDAAIEQVGKEKWKEKWAAVKKAIVTKDASCLHDGDSKPQYQGYPGAYFLSCRAQEDQRPSVVDARGKPLTAKDGRIYSGCYVIALVEIWAQDNSFGKRINAQVRGIQFYRDGDAFGAGSAASDDEFEDVSEGADAADIGDDADDLT